MQKREEKQAEGAIVINNPALRWLDNFWYHHKWAVIVSAFFIFTAVVCFVQCSSRATGDITLTFAGGQTLNAEQQAAVIDVFDAIAPEKEDETPMTTLLTSFSVYTEEEMKAACTDEDGKFSPSAYANFDQVTKDHLNSFGNYVMTGESGIWLVSENVYKLQNLKKLARPIEDSDNIPEAWKYDEYAVRLSETELYKYYDVLRILPEDTLIVMSQPLVMGAVSNEDVYADYFSMYQAILQFKAP